MMSSKTNQFDIQNKTITVNDRVAFGLSKNHNYMTLGVVVDVDSSGVSVLPDNHIYARFIEDTKSKIVIIPKGE